MKYIVLNKIYFTKYKEQLILIFQHEINDKEFLNIG